MSNGILLVHGAWHTGSTWDQLAVRLRDHGIPVAVAELHRGSLAADIAAAADAASALAGPVVACGHSYGGTVVSGLPVELVEHLVFLAGPMLDVGETTLGSIATFPTALQDCLIPGPDGTTTLDPARAGKLLHHQLSPEQQARNVAHLVPQAMAAGHHQATTATWRSRPSTYVVCTADHCVHPELQRRFSLRATHAVTLSSDHGCHLSHEDEIATLLARIASDRRATRRPAAGPHREQR